MYSQAQYDKIDMWAGEYNFTTGNMFNDSYVYAMALEMLNKFMELADEWLDLHINLIRHPSINADTRINNFLSYMYDTIAGLSFGKFGDSRNGYSKEFYEIEEQIKTCEAHAKENLLKQREKLVRHYEPSVKLKVDLVSSKCFNEMIRVLYIYEDVQQKIPEDIKTKNEGYIRHKVYNKLLKFGSFGSSEKHNNTDMHPLVIH